jgi:alpha-1,3-fucosyltransferase 10
LNHEQWSLLHEESPKNNYVFSFESIMKMFNHTATFKRHSDVPLTTQWLQSIDDLVDQTYVIDVKDKTQIQRNENLAPIIYIQSDCNTPSDRDLYIEELMKYIPIDSYGTCLHNKDLPEK